ncbi:MAG: hypothetical protein NTW19_04185, partial [Planctomycetota bacterium]|nr:hypothetical protein [Planctomycetota bacterium]
NKQIPADLAIIGTDAIGGYLCLAVRGESLGALFVWDQNHEYLIEYDAGSEPNYANVERIASDWNEFTRGLVDDGSHDPSKSP